LGGGYGGEDGRWIDHPRLYHRSGLPSVYTSEPYGHDDDDLVDVCRRLGLIAFVYPADESFWNPGETDLIVLVAPRDRERYRVIELEHRQTFAEIEAPRLVIQIPGLQ
jgi:hypothetical protein